MSHPLSRWLTTALALVVLVTLGACDDDESSGVADEDLPGSGPPSAGEASEADASEEPTTTPTPSPTSASDADEQCLIDGSPWKVSTPDLEQQFYGVLRGIDVTDVKMAGGQTLVVGPGLEATFTPNSSVRITVDLGDGLVMVMVQQHSGSATGVWELGDGLLTSTAPWSGDLRLKTRVTINGRSANSPVRLPAGGLSDAAVTFSCQPNELMMQVEGSPFSYLFR